MMEPQEFMQNLENMKKTDPSRYVQMMAIMKAVGSPPEPIIQLLDRLEIPWARTKIGNDMCMAIKWKDLMEGERKLQEQGPILKRLMEEQQQAKGE